MRHPWTILVLLILGPLTSIAVAWGCAAWVNPWPDPGRSRVGYAAALGGAGDVHAAWRVHWQHLPGYTSITSWWTDPGVIPEGPFLPRDDPAARLPGWAEGFRPHDIGAAPGTHVRVASAWGWPMVALWYGQSGDTAGTGPLMVDLGHGIELPSVMRTFPGGGHKALMSRFLPLRPIWLGLAVNSLVYAILWIPLLWLIFALLAPLRRRLARCRLARGQCPSCRYELRGDRSQRCPECGAALSPGH